MHLGGFTGPKLSPRGGVRLKELCTLSWWIIQHVVRDEAVNGHLPNASLSVLAPGPLAGSAGSRERPLAHAHLVQLRF